MCLSKKCKIKPGTAVRGTLATRKPSETLWPVDLVGFQQALSISKTFNSWSLRFILTVMGWWKTGPFVWQVPWWEKEVGMYVCGWCLAGLWEGSDWSVSVKMVFSRDRFLCCSVCTWMFALYSPVEQMPLPDHRKGRIYREPCRFSWRGAEATSQLWWQLSSSLHTSLQLFTALFGLIRQLQRFSAQWN